MSDLSLISRAPVRVCVGGRDFALPFRPAAEWMAASRRLSTLVSQLAAPEDRETLVDLVMDHPRAADDLISEGRRVLREMTGRPWYEAQKLINTSLAADALGRLVLAGVDPWQRTIGEWCAALYALYVKGADTKERTKLDFALAVPPPGAEDEWDDGGSDPEATAAAVAAMMGQ